MIKHTALRGQEALQWSYLLYTLVFFKVKTFPIPCRLR